MPDFDIANLATLAQLDLSAEETSALQKDLESILGYVDRLGEIATEGVAPMAHPLIADTPLRDDQPRPWFSREQALANAPAARHGMFEVPKIVDRG